MMTDDVLPYTTSPGALTSVSHTTMTECGVTDCRYGPRTRRTFTAVIDGGGGEGDKGVDSRVGVDVVMAGDGVAVLVGVGVDVSATGATFGDGDGTNIVAGAGGGFAIPWHAFRPMLNMRAYIATVKTTRLISHLLQ
jgi:hypothetical protein